MQTQVGGINFTFKSSLLLFGSIKSTFCLTANKMSD